MKKNFKIGQSNEIISGHSVYDVHNSYDYVGCLLKNDRTFWLFFAPSSTHGAGQTPVAVEFAGVDFLGFSLGFGTNAIQDLEEMGYKSPSDLDDNWLLREDQATASDHLFFRFVDNAYVRVHGESARIHEGVTLP